MTDQTLSRGGSISRGWVTLIVILGVLGTLIAVPVVSYISAFSAGNRLQQLIVAARQDSENVLSQYMQKVKEAAQIPAMQRDDLIAVFTGANEARYGKTGSHAIVQWIQEQNPNLDQATYLQIQRIIEAGRNEFQKSQTKVIDTKRLYGTELGSFWRGFWLKQAGYPHIRIGFPIGTPDDYPIVSVAGATDAFKSGKEEGPIKLREKQ